MPTRSLVLLAASLLTGCLAVLVLVQDSDLLLLREHLNHPFALGVLACALMTLGALGLRWRWVRTTIIILAGLGASAALFVGLIATALTATEEVGFVDGPAPYRVRLQQSAAGLGPDAIMRLSIRKDDGLHSREWYLGCFSGDDPADAFDSVRWTGPSSVEIRVVDGRTFPVALDPVSGRPRTTASVDC
ncbi:hypothetical protein [Nonomuraea sp. NPDC003709]|uniref:hypothetical protein n=1 Tax=Nonomuraea sp. NPDC003709 TaxID=3154450 RepID=UPI0033B50E36